MGHRKTTVTPECSQTGLTLEFPEEQVILDAARPIFKKLGALEEPLRIATINKLRRMIHMYSPFMNEPVDCVEWIPSEQIEANDYNPNVVAPPEMKLLRHSIEEDGYTQPIVAWLNSGHYEVVDGFHRHRVGRECENVRARIRGFLPLAIINAGREDRGDRIASTIRHNRARGKHQIQGMSDIVIELRRRNWSENKIGKELGMDPDEVLRLCQISGLAEMFADREFSEAWEADQISETDTLDIEDEAPSEANIPSL